MGTGKTYVGRRLARVLGCSCLDTDGFIEQALGRPISYIFSQLGESVFRYCERKVVRDCVVPSDGVFSLGGGTFLDAWSRSKLLSKGPVVVLWADPETIAQRVVMDRETTRPLLGEDNPDFLDRIRSLLSEREIHYKRGHIHVWTQNRHREDIVEEIVYKLWQYRYGQLHET